MKITDIRAFQPLTPGSPPDWRTQFGQIVVEVHTDRGITGIGVGGGGFAGIHVIETVLRDLLIGQDPRHNMALHGLMCDTTQFYGRKGIVVMAISGVDLAMWDLFAKAIGKPVARLLKRDCDPSPAIPTYTTVFDADDLEAAVAAGHAGVKLHVDTMIDSTRPSDIASVVREARDRIGPDPLLAIDAFARWSIYTALAVAEAVVDCDVAWLEEPLPPHDLSGYTELTERSPVPIAAGEHEYLIEGFIELVERGCCAILQPDVNWCGGMTTLANVYRLAERAGVRVVPHRGCEPFALPALAALDPNPLAESPRTWFNCLDGAPTIEAGFIRPSSAPGFGVNVACPPKPGHCGGRA